MLTGMYLYTTMYLRMSLVYYYYMYAYKYKWKVRDMLLSLLLRMYLRILEYSKWKVGRCMYMYNSTESI